MIAVSLLSILAGTLEANDRLMVVSVSVLVLTRPYPYPYPYPYP